MADANKVALKVIDKAIHAVERKIKFYLSTRWRSEVMKFQKPNDTEIFGTLILLGPLLFCIVQKIIEELR